MLDCRVSRLREIGELAHLVVFRLEVPGHVCQIENLEGLRRILGNSIVDFADGINDGLPDILLSKGVVAAAAVELPRH